MVAIAYATFPFLAWRAGLEPGIKHVRSCGVCVEPFIFSSCITGSIPFLSIILAYLGWAPANTYMNLVSPLMQDEF
jgi:hypothetical protein